ncbi:helix-turn-helix transcriptional regulator [Streptomyces europaeiscabiei]|uniref:helix-turn-helix domain-containing protein n=1 Tax=Streptomyces europaeiscabiei TaxID=146819 RepID=UPI002E1465CA|nr:helix-turn-helix domain-containing protein [Streptomyces europaeiscabiei]
MPRRPTPLKPEDGPRARFALALRQLRDEAGFDAPPVDVIAARTGIPRATLYHAMRGTRVPTLPVLAALVRAYGGDEAEWTKFRSKVEDELERERLELRELLGRERPPHDGDQGEPREGWTGGTLFNRGPSAREQHMHMLISALADLDDPYARNLVDEGTIDEYVRDSPLDPERRRLNKEARQKALARIAASEAAEDAHASATQWADWRRLAGNPRIRTIAIDARLSFKAVSEVLRGLVDPCEEPEIVETVFNVLRTHAGHEGLSLDSVAPYASDE